MRPSLSALLAALGLIAVPAALQMPLAQAQTQAVSASQPQQAARVIVKYRSGSSAMRTLDANRGESTAAARGPQQAAALSRRHGVAMTDGLAIGRRAQVVFAQGMNSAQLAALLAKDPEVEYAEPDQKRRIRAIPNDPLYPNNLVGATPVSGQWYLRPPTSTNVSAINAQTAWDVTTGSASVVVAVLDTGIRFDHPDLAGKTYPGYDFVASVAQANDGNGRDADASDPGDWVTDAEVNDSSSPFYQCTDPDPDTGQYSGENSSWHGTQVAGLIGAATHNSVGMASVGWNVMVLPVRVLGKCHGFDSDIQAGMLWAAGLSANPVANPNPAQILNLSLGSQGACTNSYRDVVSQLTAAGVTVVASAGNDAGLAVNAPANCPGVIAVAGVRHVGTKVGFSSLGSQVAIAAPGGNCVNLTGPCLNPLLTTTNSGATTPLTSTYTDSFDISVGTSFSAPLVAGTAALMKSANASMSPSQVRSVLECSARAFPSPSTDPSVPSCRAPDSNEQLECHCTTSTCGAGFLDAGAALAAAAGFGASPPSAVVTASATSVVSGNAVTLDASMSAAAGGRSVRGYRWSITSGSSFGSLSATEGATVTLNTMGSGTVSVTLTVTDTACDVAQASTSVTVTPVTSGGGGGGGGLGWAWLAALAAAVAALSVSAAGRTRA